MEEKRWGAAVSLVGVERLVDLYIGLDGRGLKVGDVVLFGKRFCHLLDLQKVETRRLGKEVVLDLCVEPAVEPVDEFSAFK